jgi:hypothetical protein
MLGLVRNIHTGRGSRLVQPARKCASVRYTEFLYSVIALQPICLQPVCRNTTRLAAQLTVQTF